MRTLAWHISSRWLGWTGPKKEALRRQYVYDPARDLSNGNDGSLKTDIPFLDSEDAAKSEYWLAYWPRVASKSTCRTTAGEGLSTALEKPFIDCWIFEESAASLATREWLTEGAIVSNAANAAESDMVLDDGIRSNPIHFTCLDESPLMANISGVQLFKEAYLPVVDYITNSGSTPPPAQGDNTLPSGDCYVETFGCTSALRQLAAHVSARLPVLLSSPPSAGKAATLRELHRLLYTLAGSTSKPKHDIVTINLADKSLDAKNLLGTLTSSPTEPGTFIFAEGSLTRALKYGRWVVLDDVDKASDEVLSTVSELVERMKTRSQRYIGGGWGGGSHDNIGVSAGGHWVEAAPGFMLFATRSVPNTAAQDSIPQIPSFFGAQYWSQIWMDAPSQEEVHSIVEERFPGLASGIASTVVQTWAAICEASNSLSSTSSTGLSRSVGIRDLVKWCHRIEQAIPTDLKVTSLSQNPRLQDEVFLEAKDIFLNSFSSRTTLYANILQALEEGLGLSPERIDWALHHRVPEICTPGHPAAASIQYGRITLGKGKQSLSAEVDKRPYALTKPFLVLLEELAACVRSHEPILLVGETGTGKTTAVAQLADMLGFRLTALNLSNQTEASDLLGGFRPINEAEELARESVTLDTFASEPC
jgi:midasin